MAFPALTRNAQDCPCVRGRGESVWRVPERRFCKAQD
jgi:hypothetical protein